MFTKFNVRLWLMYSLFPGLFGAAAAFALLQGYGNSALTIFGGIGAALLIGLAMEFSVIIKAKKDIKEQQAAQLKNEKEQSAKNMSNFYAECCNFKIFSESDLSSPEKQQRFERLAAKYGLAGFSRGELLVILTDEKAKHEAKQAEKEVENRKELDKKRNDEKKQLAELEQYMAFQGVEKTQKMLEDEIFLLKNRISESMHNPVVIAKQKESDGMFAAGTAYGIGGIVPAAASMAETQRKNARIRQTNAAIDALNSQLAGIAAMETANREGIKKRMEKFKDRAATLLTNDDGKAVFSHLKFDRPTVTVAETGTVTVSVKVTDDGGIKVFNKPAVADGSVAAEIYDNEGKMVGVAVMVFPVFGTGNLIYRQKVYGWRENDPAVELTGMCTGCGKKGQRYTVKFSPYKLWAMEK